jgi:hypothetical protein
MTTTSGLATISTNKEVITMDADSYTRLIKDAEWRLGCWIAGGGKAQDDYARKQIKNIRVWSVKLGEYVANHA